MKAGLIERIAICSFVAMGGHMFLAPPVIADDAGYASLNSQTAPTLSIVNESRINRDIDQVILPDKSNHKAGDLLQSKASPVHESSNDSANLQSERAVRSLLDSIVARRMVFHSPQVMELDEHNEIRLTLELTGGRDSFGKLSMHELMEQVQVKAVLSSATLTVQNTTPELIPLHLGHLHQWRWQVSGVEDGRQRLHLIVSIASHGQHQTLKSLDRKITIRPMKLSSRQLFIKVLNQYALWISVGLLLMIFLIALLRNRGPLQDDPSEEYLGPERRKDQRRTDREDRRASSDREVLINSRRNGVSDRRVAGYDRRKM